MSLLSREPDPSWVCWARALVLSPPPTLLPHSWRLHPSSPSNKPAYRFYFFGPDPFADACVGPDRVGMGGSGCLLHSSSSSDVLRPDLLPRSAHFWANPGPMRGWPAVQGLRPPCSGGFRAVEGGLGIGASPTGIAVGHVYYFLEDVFPNQPGGKRLLLTPGFL